MWAYALKDKTEVYRALVGLHPPWYTLCIPWIHQHPDTEHGEVAGCGLAASGTSPYRHGPILDSCNLRSMAKSSR